MNGIHESVSVNANDYDYDCGDYCRGHGCAEEILPRSYHLGTNWHTCFSSKSVTNPQNCPFQFYHHLFDLGQISQDQQ